MKDCWFSEVCSGYLDCNICQRKGLYYLASKLYIDQTNIPLRYLSLKLTDLKLAEEAAEITRYMANIRDLVNEGKGLYAYGTQTGTGKTSICCIILIRYLFRSLLEDPYNTDNRRVFYINTTEFLDRIRKSFNNKDQELDGVLEELMDIDHAPKLILFDDLGAEKPSDWVRERLYTLINFRVSNNLASLYTSNQSLAHLHPRIGSRIVSRLEGSAKQIEFTGPDHRRCDW